MIFWLFILFIILQRIVELVHARKNEKWIKSLGGYEVGHKHYKFIVLMHIFFFLTLMVEVSLFDKNLSYFYPLLFGLFFVTQIVRLWAISSLGRYWNTKIIVLPTHQIVKVGPYKYLKHPNYLIVSFEIILIPLLFQAYGTAVIFTLMNLIILSIRIPIEERALQGYFNEKHIELKSN
ncbi:isoprenylcysteine carboxyl methyltransferase family protein [Fredinandcohnia quinoae]|uniref:15-methylpalmitoyl-4-hydroxy-2-pyrone 4-O-methyltransferase n=1 Tax=Fredinandcohnia quinoae TaxID=2918902 RepID=A0AAW5E351_9BACI|nr:isoprenylcysteine carboxylmethyltransferase family protein [Fredinandcohnia sp. SECRCQ15]MCH1627345.1 hypothetical protein [Fredinandcohnia sp. SECRCQ15]